MARSLLVRNVDDELVRELKLRAARHNRSAEAEHREILKQALTGEPKQSFQEIAARIRERLRGRHHTPAEELIRESRDER